MNALKKQAYSDVRTHFKPREKFQQTRFKSSHLPGVKKSFVKGEALRLLRTNSSRTNFKTRLPNQKATKKTQINNTSAEIDFDNRSAALQQKPKTRNKILPFVTKCNPAAPNVKEILLKNWYLIPNQPELNRYPSHNRRRVVQKNATSQRHARWS